MIPTPDFVMLIAHDATGYEQHYAFDMYSSRWQHREIFLAWCKRKKIPIKEHSDYRWSVYKKVQS